MMTEEQAIALKDAMAILKDAVNDKKERYVLHTTDYNGTRPEILTRAAYLEFVVSSVEEQLGLAFDEE
jgi:hypothetical protein